MLTVMMETRDNEAELALTLSVLVAGAVEGIISDVIILDHGSSDGSSRIADAAGCRFCQTWDLRHVFLSARGEWLLMLEPGARPMGRWIDETAEYIATATVPARFSPSRLHRPPFFRRIGRRRAALETGLLIPKNQAIAMARNGMRLSDIASGLSLRRLETEIVPADVAVRNRIRDIGR